MTNLYSRVDLSTFSAAEPAPLPLQLVGLTDDSLADLSAALDPTPDEFEDIGFWPVVEADVEEPVLDHEGERYLVPMPSPPPAPEPQPKILGKLEFIGLAQSAGGMSDAQLVAAYKSPQLEAFWVKYQMASQVIRDHAVTTQALGALDALGFLPNGAEAVLEAWPAQ